MVKTNIRKYDHFKTYYWHNAICVGEYRFPLLKPTQSIPLSAIGFNEINKLKENDILWVDFFIDDYLFERIWNRCDYYISILKKAQGVIGPDFSMFPELNPAQNIWNCARNRIIAYYFQERGLNVVPTVSWCSLEDFHWCLDGLPKESSVAISSNGCLSCPYSINIFLKGINIVQEMLNPSHLIISGRHMKELDNYDNIHYYDCFSQRMHKRINRNKLIKKKDNLYLPIDFD